MMEDFYDEDRVGCGNELGGVANLIRGCIKFETPFGHPYLSLPPSRGKRFRTLGLTRTALRGVQTLGDAVDVFIGFVNDAEAASSIRTGPWPIIAGACLINSRIAS